MADRFHLEVHWETQQASVYALQLDRPGRLGPNLKPHAEDPPCDPKTFTAAADKFTCGNIGARPDPQNGGIVMGARNITMAFLATYLPNMGGDEIDRPVVDRTGLSGGFDFSVAGAALMIPGIGTAKTAPDSDLREPSFRQMLREQLGLKLESATAPVRVLIIDRVERPAEN